MADALDNQSKSSPEEAAATKVANYQSKIMAAQKAGNDKAAAKLKRELNDVFNNAVRGSYSRVHTLIENEASGAEFIGGRPNRLLDLDELKAAHALSASKELGAGQRSEEIVQHEAGLLLNGGAPVLNDVRASITQRAEHQYKTVKENYNLNTPNHDATETPYDAIDINKVAALELDRLKKIFPDHVKEAMSSTMQETDPTKAADPIAILAQLTKETVRRK